MTNVTRRRFMQGASALAGSALVLPRRPALASVLGANDRVRIAVAGLNGRGWEHVTGWLAQENVEIAYLVDPDRTVLDRAMTKLRALTKGEFTARGVADVRVALEDRHVDALSIATPNHWHALMTIWDAQAGKHVYVEKPMSHDIAEGRIVVEAQKKYGVVIQHGTQKRSDAGIAGLHEAIKTGRFGRLKISYGYCCKPRVGIGFESDAEPPTHLDWDLWRGPAKIDRYHANYVHYDWHWFWKTGNGDLNNQGTHELDVARWALDDDQTMPVRARAIGGRFLWKDQGETPNTLFGIAEYPNGQQVFFNVRNVNYEGYERQVENEYYFEDGSYIRRGRHYEKGSGEGRPLDLPPGKVTPGGNWGSFIRAVRAGDPKLANGTAIDAHHACVLGHVINDSYRLGERVPFDARSGRFGDDADAHEHFQRLHAIMSHGVGIPQEGSHYVLGPWLAFDPQEERFVGERASEANALRKDENRAGFEVPSLAKL